MTAALALKSARAASPKPKHAPSPAVWWNGSTATLRRPCRAGVSVVAVESDLAIRCYRSGSTLSATPGCIARVGGNGVGRGRSRLSLHLLRWAFEHVGMPMSQETAQGGESSA
jgi:hypothetical protein